MPFRNMFYLGVVVGLLAACSSAKSGGSGDDDDGTGDGGPDLPIDAAAHPVGILHVSVDGNDGNDGLDPARPMRHIGLAIERAAACTPEPCRIHLAEGTFEEAVTLTAGIDLQGGWSLDFATQDLGIHPVVITSTEPVTVTADALAASTLFEGITIRGADLGGSDDGASSIGLLVRDCGEQLQLRNVRVEGGRGAAGHDGDDGTLTSCDAQGGSGGTAYDCGGDDGTLGAAAGDPPAGGAAGSPGTSNCPDACPLVGHDGISSGSGGGNGANGANGASGVAATDDDGAFADDVWAGGAGGAGERGLNGTGGSGGGPGGTKRFRACFGCGTLLGGRGGDGAPGGCGGDGGEAGTAGGASFGIVIIRSMLLIESVSVVGGRGGDAGDGGDGHPGSPGGTDGTVDMDGAPHQQCGLITYYAGAGAPGGIGGHGGNGGGGAGGAGGPSIGVALVQGGFAAVGEPSMLDVELGTGGAGGSGGTGGTDAPNGPSGRVADVVVY